MTSTIEPSPPTEPESPAAEIVGANKWRTLISVSLGIMMVALDGTVVSVANPTIGRDLHASLSDLQWVTNGYLLAIAVLLVFGGRLGDRFGRKRLFMIGMAGFALGSLGCALSPSIDVLILFRVIQGMFGAMMLPATLACLRAAFPSDELEKAVGIWGGTSAIATASGPIIGGLLVQHVSWESIFLLNLPLGALALVVAYFSITETKDVDSGSGLDPVGVVLLSASLFALAWGLIKSQTHGWGSAYTLGFLAAAVVLTLVFIVWENRVKVPLIPLGLFKSPSFSAGVVLVILGLFALYGVLFFMTLYLQRVHGYSPVQAGVRLLPLTATFSISSPLGGVLTARFGPRVPLFIGMVLMGAAFLGLRSIGIDTSYNGQWPWFVAVGIALGLIIVASTQAIVGNAPVDKAGVAGGIQQTGFQLGGVIGTSVLGTIIVAGVSAHFAGHLSALGVPAKAASQLSTTAVHQAVSQGIVPAVPHALVVPVTQASYLAFLDGLHNAMLVSAIVSFVGAGLALLVKRGHEVEGRRRRREASMTTLDNRPNTALLVVDVQNSVVAGASRRDQVVANIGQLVDLARTQQISIVWVQDSLDGQTGSDEWQIVPELSPDASEPLIHKHYGDSFEATDLESVLSGLGIGRLVVVGAQTDMCIRSTLHGALARGYDATLVSDAHTTEDLTAWGAPPPEQVISHTNMYWGAQTAPGRIAGTVETADVSFSG